MKPSQLLLTFFLWPLLALAAEAEPPAYYDKVVEAHGIIGCLAVVIFFPLGAILLRVGRIPGAVWIHAGCQVFALALLTINVGMGIWMANTTEQLDYYHPIVALVLFILAWLQPLGGLTHHYVYKAQQRRTLLAHLHIRLGAIIITLGIVSGGLGLMFGGDATTGERVAYAVIGGAMWIAYMVTSVLAEERREVKESLEKMGGSSALGSGDVAA